MLRTLRIHVTKLIATKAKKISLLFFLCYFEKYVHKPSSVSQNSAQSDDDDDTCIFSSCDLIIRVFVEVE